METQALNPATPQPAAPEGAGRLDIYAGIHKALRMFMTSTLGRIGSTDPREPAEVGETLRQLERLLGLCELHLKDENEFIHPALERARAGSSARAGVDHEHHVEAFADLRDLAGLVAHSADANRAAALQRLYRAFALFVADNFQHMHVEETAHNAVLWAAYGDAELAEIEHAIVASIPPQAMAEALHWFFPALNAPERAGMRAGMREGMPAEAYAGVLGIAEATLPAADFARLQRDVAGPVEAHLKTT